jgi:hypothetical protein
MDPAPDVAGSESSERSSSFDIGRSHPALVVYFGGTVIEDVHPVDEIFWDRL